MLKNIMDRLTHSTGRSKHLEQNLSRLDIVVRNNNSTSAYQEKTALPTLKNIAEKNIIKLYPFNQQNEYKYKDLLNSSETDSSSIVESSSSSDEDDNGGFKKTASKITLSSRPSSTQKKNSVTAVEVQSTSFFEHMPWDVIRKILFENLIDLNDIPKSAKNLMHFASISKFNREYVRVLLTEEGMREVSFEITKSVIPNLLATLAGDDKAEFTQADVDSLVHEWPYLTVDCSYKENLFSARGLKAVNDILFHPGLQGARIINNLPANDADWNQDHHVCNYYGLELIHTLLSKKSSSPVKVDFFFNNWMPPLQYKDQLKDKSINNFQLNEKSIDRIKEIQDRSDGCESVIFGEINLTRSQEAYAFAMLFGRDQCTLIQDEYRFNFAKMMCKIALQHSAHTISFAGFVLGDSEVGLILDEIQKFDDKNLQHLDLSGNHIGCTAANKLSVWLQSEDIFLKTLKLDGLACKSEEFAILEKAIKKNNSLELVEIKDVLAFVADHSILNDKRVRLTQYLI